MLDSDFVTYRCGVCGNTMTVPITSMCQPNLDCWHYDEKGDSYISFMQEINND